MASTSTNKAPLLEDRPLLEICRLDGTSTPAGSVDPGTGTGGTLLVDCTSNDGAVLHDIWLIQRVAGDTSSVNLYLSSSATVLGTITTGQQVDSWFLGQFGFSVGGDPGSTLSFQMPKILAPVPHAGSNVGVNSDEPPQFRGLLLRKGLALWAAVNSATPVAGAPLIAVQGGFF